MYFSMLQWCKWRIFISNGWGWWNFLLCGGCRVVLMPQALRAPGFSPVPVLCHCLKRPVSPMPPLIPRVSQACKALWGSGSFSFSCCLSGPKNILIPTQSRKETCFSCSCVFKCPVEWGLTLLGLENLVEACQDVEFGLMQMLGRILPLKYIPGFFWLGKPP